MSTIDEPAPTEAQRTGFIARYLDPVDSLSEITCGLVMVLTILLSAGFWVEGSDNPGQTLLITAIGCNLAWGLIDGLLYVMGDVYDRSRKAAFVRTLQAMPPERAFLALRDRLDDDLAAVLTADKLDAITRTALAAAERAEPPDEVHPGKASWGAAAAAALLNLLALVPAVIPFALVDDWKVALRISCVLLVVMMFGTGFAWGRFTQAGRWKAGFGMLGLGSVMVAIAVAFGG